MAKIDAKSKTEADFNARNSSSAAGLLRSGVERFEQLESEKKDVAEQQKELLAELKGQGIDTKVFRAIVAERKKNADDVMEFEAILDMYREVLGMSSGGYGQGPVADDDEPKPKAKPTKKTIAAPDGSGADDDDGMV